MQRRSVLSSFADRPGSILRTTDDSLLGGIDPAINDGSLLEGSDADDDFLDFLSCIAPKIGEQPDFVSLRPDFDTLEHSVLCLSDVELGCRPDFDDGRSSLDGLTLPVVLGDDIFRSLSLFG